MQYLPQLQWGTPSGIKPTVVEMNTETLDSGSANAWPTVTKNATWTDKIAKITLRTGIDANRSECSPSLNYFKLNQIEFIGDHSNKQQYPAAKQIFLHQKKAKSSVTSEKNLPELRPAEPNSPEELPLKKATGA